MSKSKPSLWNETRFTKWSFLEGLPSTFLRASGFHLIKSHDCHLVTEKETELQGNIWQRRYDQDFPLWLDFQGIKRIIVLHCTGCSSLVSSIFSWAKSILICMNSQIFLAPLVLSDLQVKLVPVLPCALCTPQILYRLSRSSYSNLNDPDPLPPQRFCILSHSTYSNLKRLPAGEIACWLSSVQKIHRQQSHLCKELRSKILHNWPLQWVGTRYIH